LYTIKNVNPASIDTGEAYGYNCSYKDDTLIFKTLECYTFSRYFQVKGNLRALDITTGDTPQDLIRDAISDNRRKYSLSKEAAVGRSCSKFFGR